MGMHWPGCRLKFVWPGYAWRESGSIYVYGIDAQTSICMRTPSFIRCASGCPVDCSTGISLSVSHSAGQTTFLQSVFDLILSANLMDADVFLSHCDGIGVSWSHHSGCNFAAIFIYQWQSILPYFLQPHCILATNSAPGAALRSASDLIKFLSWLLCGTTVHCLHASQMPKLQKNKHTNRKIGKQIKAEKLTMRNKVQKWFIGCSWKFQNPKENILTTVHLFLTPKTSV